MDTNFQAQNIPENPHLWMGNPLETTFCPQYFPGNPLLSVGNPLDTTFGPQNIPGNPLLSVGNPLDITICWSGIHCKLRYLSEIPGNLLSWGISPKPPSTPQESPGILILPLKTAPGNPLVTLRILCKPLFVGVNHLLSVGNSSVTLFCPKESP